jgi:hypothetical protein
MFVFCIFLTVHLPEFFLFVGLHYLLMLIWVLAMRSNFCGSIDGVRRPVAEFVYNLVIAAVLLFDIINITEGPTRLKNIMFYTLSGLEQAGLLAAWHLATYGQQAAVGEPLPWSHSAGVQTAALALVPATFLLGLLALTTYYRGLHPGGRMPDWAATPRIL